MRQRLDGFLLLLLLTAFWTCGRKDDIPDRPVLDPRLRSVTVSQSSLVLAEGESVELAFSVEDPAFVFDYTVGSASCQVRLQLGDGSVPTEFSLVRVAPAGKTGSYLATIADNGRVKEYVRQACLAIVRRNADTGTEAFTLSNEFTVKSEAASTGGVAVNTGLPVVYVNTEGGQGVYSKEEYVPAEIYIKGTDALEGLQTAPCSIRGRGNTTWYWPKKPYLIRLDEKAHVFGMHKHKRWVLLANFMDRTLMRNLVSMRVASMTSLAWTPGCQSVELVLNGKHLGNYLLIEQVRVDNHRVDISKDGYLLELDFHFDNKVQWVDPHGRSSVSGGIPFAVKYPDVDSLTPQRLDAIKQEITRTATALYGADFQDPDKGYEKYLDVDSFIDYWIVYEVMGNHELGNPGSVFMHKEAGGKLVAGPCWDFDWGVLSYNTSPHARTGLVNGRAIWYARLFEDPAFKARVKARFQELLPQLQTIPDYIDETEKVLEASAELNFRMWNPAEDASQNGGSIINGDENMSFHDAVARLRRIYLERLTVIPQNL